MEHCKHCGADHGPNVIHADAVERKVTAGHIVPSNYIDIQREMVINFFDEYSPGHQHQAKDMLPHPLSPTGENPPTHFYCWIRETATFIKACIAYVAKHKLPNVIEFADSEEAFLARQGLKKIKAGK
jgi:hypothetical protein